MFKLVSHNHIHVIRGKSSATERYSILIFSNVSWQGIGVPCFLCNFLCFLKTSVYVRRCLTEHFILSLYKHSLLLILKTQRNLLLEMLELKWIDIPHLLFIFNLQKLFMRHQSRLIRAISICQICENTLAFFWIHFAGKSIETSSKVLEAHTFSLFKIKVEKCISKNFKSFLDSLTKHFKKLL